MKTTVLILILSFTGIKYISAQNWDNHIIGEKYPGFIITLKGDTVKGFIRAQYPGGMLSCHQLSCMFYRTKSDTARIKYKPDDIKAYQIADKLYLSMNYSGGLISKIKNFILTTKKGAISEHIFYYTDSKLVLGQQPNESNTAYYKRIYQNKIVYYRNGITPYDSEQINFSFKKKMPELVSDNSALVAKIEAKEKGYRILNFEKIVNEYNEWSTNKK